MDLVNYYKRFLTVSGLFAGLVSAFPLFSKILPEGISRYVFPPLGQIEMPARVSVILLGVAATYVVFFYRDADFVSSKKHRRRILVAWALGSLVFIGLYLGLNLAFVRESGIPTKDTTVLVSVGYRRTDFARTTFGNATDEEMLHQRAANEEEIRRLWTLRSVIVVRLSMFIAYACSFLAPIAIFSFGVLFDFVGPATSP
jgi:hypothetical protein